MNDSPIIPAGAEPDEPEGGVRRRRGAAGLVLVGLVVGVVLGGLFGSARAPTLPTTVPEEEPVVAPPSFTTTTTRVPRDVTRLATMVPGLVDGVVITIPADLGGRQVWVWEASAEAPTPRPLPGGELAADLGGLWLSSVTPSRFSIGNALWIGDDDRMDPAATNVIGATWSSSLPARVIWSEITSTAETVLVEAELRTRGSPQRRVIARIPPGAYPVWWTEAGVVVATSRRLTFIDDAGRVAAQADGTFLAGGSTFGVAELGGSVQLVSADLTPLMEVPWGRDCGIVSFSPTDPGTVAVVCGAAADSRLEVWTMGDTEGSGWEVAVTVEGVDRVVPAWSPDGRFVASASTDRFRPRSDLVFADLETGARYRIPFRARVLGLAFTRT